LAENIYFVMKIAKVVSDEGKSGCKRKKYSYFSRFQIDIG